MSNLLPRTSSDLAPHSQFQLESPSSERMRLVDLTVHIPSSSHSQPSSDEQKQPSRWSSFEFRLYIILACIMLPIMAWIPISLSSCALEQSRFSLRVSIILLQPRTVIILIFAQDCLRVGCLVVRWYVRPLVFSLLCLIVWLIQDNSDAQYRSFRSNLIPLTLTSCIYFVIKFIWVKSSSVAVQNDLHFVSFKVVFSVLMLLALHGSSILKIFAILSVNYLIAKLCRGSKLGPALTWIFNAAVLFLNDRYSGYRFGDMSSSLEALVSLVAMICLYGSLTVLLQDSYQGIYPRWHISFNITMLRLVSFSMDYHWACTGTGRPEVRISICVG